MYIRVDWSGQEADPERERYVAGRTSASPVAASGDLFSDLYSKSSRTTHRSKITSKHLLQKHFLTTKVCTTVIENTSHRLRPTLATVQIKYGGHA